MTTLIQNVYLTTPRKDGARKIGCSSRARKRVSQLRSELRQRFDLLFEIKSSRGMWLEKYLHQAFARCRVDGEWFMLTEEDVELIMSVKRADVENDLPAKIYVLHRVNAPETKVGLQPITIRPITAASLFDLHYDTLHDLITRGVFTVVAQNGRGAGRPIFLFPDEIQLYGETRDIEKVRELRIQKGRLKPRRK